MVCVGTRSDYNRAYADGGQKYDLLPPEVAGADEAPTTMPKAANWLFSSGRSLAGRGRRRASTAALK